MAVKKTVKKTTTKAKATKAKPSKAKATKTKVKKVAKSTASKVKATAKKVVKKAAKKVVKKTVSAAKGAVTKVSEVVTPKGIEVTVKRQIGTDAPTEYHFYLKDGRKLKNVLDLVNAFDDMAEDVFEHHVTDVNNDFANWVHHVFDEEHLAKEIKAAEDRMEMHMKLLKHAVQKLSK